MVVEEEDRGRRGGGGVNQRGTRSRANLERENARKETMKKTTAEEMRRGRGRGMAGGEIVKGGVGGEVLR